MKRHVALLLFLLVILSMCLLIIGGGPFRPIKGWVYANHINDKITHIVFGAVLSFLAYYILHPYRLRIGPVKIPLGAAILFFIFTVEEGSQVFTWGRDADPFDLLASWTGLLLGTLLARLFDRKASVAKT